MTTTKPSAVPLFVLVFSTLLGCAAPRRSSPDEPRPEPEAARRAGARSGAAPVAAFDPLADGVLTLGEALALASRHPEVVLARAEVAVADARVTIAETYPHDPAVKLKASTDAAFEDEGEGERTVALSQTIETGGGLAHRAASARASRRAAVFDLEALEWRARAAVTDAYYDLLAADEGVRLADRRREIAMRLVEIAETRLRAADVSAIDANLVRASGRETEAAATTAARERRAASLRLARLLSLAPRDDLVLEGALPSPVRVEPGPLERVALRTRREILSAIAEREAARASADAARASRWPDVTVELFYTRDTSVFDVGPDSFTDRGDILGLGVEIPLPVFGRGKGERQEALADAARASERLEIAAADFRSEIRDAANRAAAAADLVALYERDLVVLARETRSLVSEAFRLGEVGAAEVLRAREEEARIDEGDLAARLEAARAIVALERAIGASLEDAMREASSEEEEAKERKEKEEERP